jgi:hypothetical protein
VTALRQADVGSAFRLVLDTGTFHGLGDVQRQAMGREVSAIAAPDATVLRDRERDDRSGRRPASLLHEMCETTGYGGPRRLRRPGVDSHCRARGGTIGD